MSEIAIFRQLANQGLLNAVKTIEWLDGHKVGGGKRPGRHWSILHSIRFGTYGSVVKQGRLSSSSKGC